MKNKIFLLLISLLLAFGLASCDKSGDGKANANSGENNNENGENESGELSTILLPIFRNI